MTKQIKRINIPVPSSRIDKPILDVLIPVRQFLVDLVGTGNNRAATIQDLLDAGLIDIVDGQPATPGAQNTVIPPAPENVQANGALDNIIVTWDLNTSESIGYAEVWRASVDNLGQAVMIGTTKAPVYPDVVGSAATYYYWVRYVANATVYVPGPFNATSGTQGSTGVDATYMLTLLSEQISETELATALKSRIALIDTPTTGLVDTASAHAATLAGHASDLANHALDIDANTAAITALSASNAGNNLDMADNCFWDFSGVNDSWTPANSSFTTHSYYITHTGSAADPSMASPTISCNGGLYPYIVARVRRVSGTGWNGVCQYSTSGHGASSSYQKAIAKPTDFDLGEWFTITLDMSNLDVGGTDWMDNTITGIQLNLGVDGSDVIEVDWVGIGRYSPPASATALSVLDARVATNEGEIATHATDIVSLQSDITGINGLRVDATFEKGISFWSDSSGNGVQTLPPMTTPDVTAVAGAGKVGGTVMQIVNMHTLYGVNAIPVDTSRKYRVRFRVRQTVDPTTGGTAPWARVALGVKCLDANYNYVTYSGRYTATPFTTVDQLPNITVADGWQEFSGIITGESSVQFGADSYFATGTVYIRLFVLANYFNGDGAAQIEFATIEDITEPQVNASAISVLDTRVTQNENDISSQSSQITSLDNRVTTNEGDIAGHSSALSTLDSRVTATENSIISNASDITSLDSRVTANEGEISGNASAINSLDTRVTSAEGTLSSHASSITSLQTNVASAINGVSNNAVAVSALDVRVTQNESDIDAQASAITTINTTVAGNSASIQTNLTSINGLQGKYTVKIDVNGYVAGFGLAVDANNATPVSNFIVNVDNFAIGSPGATNFYPFIVSGGVVYIKSAAIEDASIIDAKIGSLAADKIFAASGTIADIIVGAGHITNLMIGSYIESDNYVAGVSGWRLDKTANVEFNNGTFRGALAAASGTFAGSLSAATGTFSGSLTADAINAVSTINLAGQAVTIPVSAYTDGSITLSSSVGVQTVIQTCTIASTGSPIFVSASSTFKATFGSSTTTPLALDILFYRSGTYLSKRTIYTRTGEAFSTTFTDTPPSAGSYDYEMRVTPVDYPIDVSPPFTAQSRSIVLLEVKR